MAEAPRQLPLALPVEPAHGADDYVVGEANRAAFDLVTAARWPSDVLLLVGPEGAGKTHLAAVFAATTGAVTLAAEDLAAVDPTALGAGAIVVEDVGEGVDERALFHLLNAVRQAGGRLLLTARRPLSAWGLSLPDLVSRLRAATPVELGLPDDRLIEALLAKLFADRQTTVDPAVVGYLAADGALLRHRRPPRRGARPRGARRQGADHPAARRGGAGARLRRRTGTARTGRFCRGG